MPPEPPSSAGVAVRVIGAVLTALFGAPFLLCALVALSSRFGAGDPHGYAMIFGTAVSLIAGLLTAMSLPLAFPAARRGAALRASLLGFLLAGAGLVAALLTA